MTFPTNDLNLGTNIRIRRLGDYPVLSVELDVAERYIDETVYPELRHTKHMLVVRESDGTIVPITNFADDAARVAGGTTIGLLNLSSQLEAQPAVVYSGANCVSWWLQTPADLDPDDIYIHPAVDADTSKLHPLNVVVNSTKANAVGMVTDFHTIDGGTVDFVWGSMISEYYKDMVTPAS